LTHGPSNDTQPNEQLGLLRSITDTHNLVGVAFEFQFSWSHALLLLVVRGGWFDAVTLDRGEICGLAMRELRRDHVNVSTSEGEVE
jgi:hypothetical protein